MLLPLKDYNPTRSPAYLTILLILLNTGIFIYQAYFSNLQIEVAKNAMIPSEISHFETTGYFIAQDQTGQLFKTDVPREVTPIASIFAAMFMHGSILHLVGNMLFLWIFGNNIEDYLGRVRFLLFYLAVGIASSLVHVLFNLNSFTPVIGASGAVSGVMGGYLVLYPNARIRTLVFFIIITFIDIPAFVFLVFWFIYQFAYMGANSGVAWIAHVGGFIAGVVLIKFMRKKLQKPIVEVLQ